MSENKTYPKYTGEQVREMRKKLRLNQCAFWSAVRVTQSGGSRYESGRGIPGSVCALIYLHYGCGVDASITAEDMLVLHLLKQDKSYAAKLKQAVKDATKNVKGVPTNSSANAFWQARQDVRAVTK